MAEPDKPRKSLRDNYDPPNDNAEEFSELASLFWTVFCEGVAKWTIRIVFYLLIPLILIAFVIAAFPKLAPNPKLLIVALICVVSIGFLSGVFGFSIKSFLNKPEDLLNRILRRIVFKEPVRKKKKPYNQTTIIKDKY